VISALICGRNLWAASPLRGADRGAPSTSSAQRAPFAFPAIGGPAKNHTPLLDTAGDRNIFSLSDGGEACPGSRRSARISGQVSPSWRTGQLPLLARVHSGPG